MPTNPSLLIVPYRYKAAKLYSQLPESGAGDFIVTRSTTATRTNASGLIESVASGVPRLDYQGGGCPALLVEPAATNLVLRSEEFDNAAWVKTRTTISANSTTAPNGAATADKIVETAVTNTFLITQSISVVSGTSYTFSIYLKAAERFRGRIRILAPSANDVTFDLNAQTASGGIIQSAGNGWFRISITLTSSATLADVVINLADASGNLTYTGDVNSGIFIWGAQLETGSVATSYIPTVAATQTRNADVISVSSVSGLIGQTQGTLYAEVDVRNINQSVNRSVLFLSDGTTSNRLRMQYQFVTGRHVLVCSLIISGVTIYEKIASIGTDVVNGRLKIAFAYASGNNEIYQNGSVLSGAASGSGSFATMAGIGQINICSDQANASVFNDRIRAAAIYTSRLSNAELATLTTL